MTTVDLQALEQAIGKTRDHLLRQQRPEGYWVGELESDVSVTAGYISFMRFLGVAHAKRTRKVIHVLRGAQLASGGWSSYWGGEGNLDVSIQAYLALKLAGQPAHEPFVQQARDFILAQGGIERANTFTKIMLALFGQYDWGRLPMMPPEVMLLPNGFPITIYDFASWARATIVALTVVLAHRPIHSVPKGEGVSELYREAARPPSNAPDGLLTWRRFFLSLDRLLKAREGMAWKPGRKSALRKAEQWIVAHQEADGSWGGIMLPWVYSLVALKCLGYPNDHPVVARGLAGMETFILEDGAAMHLQPALSPVWDTAYTTIALSEAGLPPDHPALVKAAQWLLGQQVLAGGDWQVKRPQVEPGGWAFEFENDAYPDVDDSVLVPMALRAVRVPDEATKSRAIERAVDWVLSMQGRRGGWAAFDVDNDKEMLAHIPFADFMTPLDPVSADVTAHVVELLGRLGYSPTQPNLSRALAYLRGEQGENGAWFGRWGVNYIYGTAAALMGLRAAGEDMQQDYIRRAVCWLEQHQNADGGWGETCRSYEDDRWQGSGPSTASQTAWALLGLLAAGEEDRPAVSGGVEHLLRTQAGDGRWAEAAFTGTGFPRAFYLRYHMYPIYFPLMALAHFRKAIRASRSGDVNCL